ncbi:hypothetical protein [Burkholderia glumae]|uniref:hypothetical protein n=1 Tax=Burkholderia glumae TaxID=337 RepID=UPI003B9B49CE
MNWMGLGGVFCAAVGVLIDIVVMEKSGFRRGDWRRHAMTMSFVLAMVAGALTTIAGQFK